MYLLCHTVSGTESLEKKKRSRFLLSCMLYEVDITLSNLKKSRYYLDVFSETEIQSNALESGICWEALLQVYYALIPILHEI
jgi:hypothetical protein